MKEGRWRETDEVEIKALIGCLLQIGNMRRNLLPTTVILELFLWASSGKVYHEPGEIQRTFNMRQV